MTDEVYIIGITALLPLTAGMLVLQKNPYHALVIRGILGAIAALVYVLFGAADVALTEALVGTMLSITLYAVAVRSSMSLRIGVLQAELEMTSKTQIADSPDPIVIADYPPSAESCVAALKTVISKHYLRLEWTAYPSFTALNTALQEKEIHATLSLQQSTQKSSTAEKLTKVDLQTRVQRLYDIMMAELPTSANIHVIDACDSSPKANTLVEGQS
ncbi:MAG: DUF4040 domain-containing protein [Thermosynechococcaceae cyanobacterium]